MDSVISPCVCRAGKEGKEDRHGGGGISSGPKVKCAAPDVGSQVRVYLDRFYNAVSRGVNHLQLETGHCVNCVNYLYLGQVVAKR